MRGLAISDISRKKELPVNKSEELAKKVSSPFPIEGKEDKPTIKGLTELSLSCGTNLTQQAKCKCL